MTTIAKHQDIHLFREWLNNDAQIYTMYAEKPDSCPLACYFQSLGYDKVSVARYDWFYTKENDIVETIQFVPWQEKFVKRLDNAFGRDEVSAQDCIGVLEWVKEDLEAYGE